MIKQRDAKKLAEIFVAHGAVVAKSGNGDGAYPCYWFLDAKGEAVGLLIDFENWNAGR